MAARPISLEGQALALGAVAPSGAECSSARGGACFLPSEHSRDSSALVGFMHSARRAGPKTPPADFPRGKGFVVTLSGNGWSPEGERTSNGRKPASFRLFKP